MTPPVATDAGEVRSVAAAVRASQSLSGEQNKNKTKLSLSLMRAFAQISTSPVSSRTSSGHFKRVARKNLTELLNCNTNTSGDNCPRGRGHRERERFVFDPFSTTFRFSSIGSQSFGDEADQEDNDVDDEGAGRRRRFTTWTIVTWPGRLKKPLVYDSFNDLFREMLRRHHRSFFGTLRNSTGEKSARNIYRLSGYHV